ncbi:hypothetical protein [Clostridium sp.]|jgi:hypothetical protein|uniref:hypothetical protein n=1 Tax=Clostridium sp. TaxID=1506 RepID=UPI0029135455|nr:hypothetical protein [Clostridium sp.]MDU7364276.1 hypothetical protein [Clostridium sp.]
MKTNYELLKEVFKEVNEFYGCKTLYIKNVEDYLSIRYKDEEVVKIFEETLEEFEEPVEIIIQYFYENNEKAKSKELDKKLEKDMSRSFKKTLKSNNDDEILDLIRLCKELKNERDLLKEDLLWTKAVARALYLAKEIFIKKFDDEVV